MKIYGKDISRINIHAMRIPGIAARIIIFLLAFSFPSTAQELEVGISKKAISPPLGIDHAPAWIAGYGNGRQATAIHDDIWARCLLFRLTDGKKDRSIALVSLDLIGYFLPETQKIRKLFKQKHPDLPIDYILVASTHTHEGPDTMGLWGKNEHESGVNPQYLATVNEAVVQTLEAAYRNRKHARLRMGSFDLDGLTRDIRLPQVLDNAVLFMYAEDTSGKTIGTLVNFSCHPEALGADNTQITSDYPHFLREYLEKTWGGTAIFFVGSIGGLLTPAEKIYDPQEGRAAPENSWRKAQIIGETLAAKVADKIKTSSTVRIDRLGFKSAAVYVPVTNANFRLAAALKLYERPFFTAGKPDETTVPGEKMGIPAGIPQGKNIQSEVALITIGPAQILGIPGEIYPEIVVGGIQKPQEPAADFPGAPREEPPLRELLQAKYRFIFGLSNDEIGYIIPKSEWDEKAPFAYSRKSSQYGEINSCGYDTAPVLYQAIRKLIQSSDTQ
jgi:hypothetical protein